MTFKDRVYNECVDIVSSKILFLRQSLNDLKESASNETKSTAGDKHETALAMLQIEQENTNKQLEQALSQKLQLQKIVPVSEVVAIVNGALVKTNKGYFYISVALGKIKVADKLVIILSPQSPLGSKLMGLRVKDTATINGVIYLVGHIE